MNSENNELGPFEKIWNPSKLNGEGNKQTDKKHDTNEKPIEEPNESQPKHTREYLLTPDFENDFDFDILSDSKLNEKSINRKKNLGGKFENRISAVKLVWSKTINVSKDFLSTWIAESFENTNIFDCICLYPNFVSLKNTV